MKKKLIIICGIIGAIIVLLTSFYFIEARPVSKKSEAVTFTIKPGESKTVIVSNLKSAKLIRSKVAAYLFNIS